MKKIIITGATGFIGVHLVEKWIDRGAEIYAVVRPSSKNIARLPKCRNVHVVELELGCYEHLLNIVGDADFFYHLAWEGARVPYRDDALMQCHNYDCAIQAYDTAKKLGCAFFLGSGSQDEYGYTTGLVDEKYPCNPTTEYGRYKFKAGMDLLERAKRDGIKLIWTRIFSLYGPYDFSKTLVMSSIDKMLKNEPFQMTEGIQLWDYLYVSDAAEAFVLLAEKKCDSGVYNIASGEYKQLRSFVEDIKTVLKSESDLQFGVIPYGSNGPVNLMPDPSKIKSLGWMPAVGFYEGIRRISILLSLDKCGN